MRNLDYSNNFIIFTFSIGFSNSFCEFLSENTYIDDEAYILNKSENLWEAYNKLFEMLLTETKCKNIIEDHKVDEESRRKRTQVGI